MTNLLKRVERVRLPLSDIARSAEIDKNTVHRVLKTDRGVRRDKLQAVEAAVVAEELALLDHLRALHGEAAR